MIYDTCVCTVPVPSVLPIGFERPLDLDSIINLIPRVEVIKQLALPLLEYGKYCAVKYCLKCS